MSYERSLTAFVDGNMFSANIHSLEQIQFKEMRWLLRWLKAAGRAERDDKGVHN